MKKMYIPHLLISGLAASVSILSSLQTQPAWLIPFIPLFAAMLAFLGILSLIVAQKELRGEMRWTGSVLKFIFKRIYLILFAATALTTTIGAVAIL